MTVNSELLENDVTSEDETGLRGYGDVLDDIRSIENESSYIDHDIDFDQYMSDALIGSNVCKEKGIVSGFIRAIDREKDIVIVDVGLKSDGIIPMKEFYREGEKDSIQVGDEIELYVSSIDSKAGGLTVSREKVWREKSWNKIVHAYQNKEGVDGIAFSRVKGGLAVDFEGVIGFLPGSQIDVRPVKDVSDVVGVKQPFRIMNLNKKNRSIMVSRRLVLAEDVGGKRCKFLDSIKVGDIIDGVVKNITNYGVFVDLGSIDGLLHITDISWEKIAHPSEMLDIGQKVKVKIIRYDREYGKISLGLKQLADNPWSAIKDDYHVGKVVKGTVTNVTNYGTFVQLEKGIEGLIHVSEMSWSKDNYKKCKEIQQGDAIEAMVLEFDVDKHRIALGLKQLQDNPWEEFVQNHNTGEIIEGEIRNVTDFGLFVSLGNDMDGLVHISDLSWNADSNTELSKYNKGDIIKTIYIEGDAQNQKVRLGIKQLTDNPFQKYSDIIKMDAVLTCKVSAIKKDGIDVEIVPGIISFIRKSYLARDRIEQRPDRFVVGNKVDAKIIFYDEKTKKVMLSIKAVEDEDHAKAIKEYGSADIGATIGDILGDALKVDERKMSSYNIDEEESE